VYLRYYLVYAGGPRPRAEASPLPEQTAFRLARETGCDRLWVGDRPVPHWLAADLVKQVQTALMESPGGGDQRRRLGALIGRRLWRWGYPPGFSWELVTPLPAMPTADWEQILDRLSGRIIFAAEAGPLLRGATEDPETVLAELAVAGEIEFWPAIEVLHFGRAVCRRCGETQLEREDCWLCGDSRCWVCPTCRDLGAATGCRTLYAKARSHSEPILSIAGPLLDFSLTSAQERAAARFRAFISSGPGDEFLIWAVCGAGKTEVVLAGLAEAFARGARTLLATPRRDVAADLAARASAAFPGIALAVHYGGRHEGGTLDPALTVATTHQCLRFFQAFDLVILDELDAFPFHGNWMLYTAVQRARRPGGRAAYLTATPPRLLERRASGGTLPYVRLPVRPHGYPLPVPELVRIALGRPGTDWCPPRILAALLGGDRRGLVFVPSVDRALQIGRALARWGEGRGRRVSYIYAADRDRDGKLKAFAEGKLDLLVTTTLLERGLTLGAIDVYVLFAGNESVFDTACLIQIAGRAGRLAADPAGKVVFADERISPAMAAARASILAANDEAGAEGYLVGRPL